MQADTIPPSPAADDPGVFLDSLRGRSVGLVVNHTSRCGTKHLVDTLISLGCDIRTVFTPEHGFTGTADAGASIDDGIYGKSSIPVVSLYGKKKKPSSGDLQGIDLLIFDIQDVGVRTYTYISTLQYVMEAAVMHNIPLMVLDRPNPNGFYIDGPVLQSQYKSFVGMHPVPLVHGLTIGEYALMINGEGWLPDSQQCDLTIIPCQNYGHADRYTLDVAPSPNLKNMHAVYLYPSLVLFEGTVVSVGRGTQFPFTVYGHPLYPDTSFSFVPMPLEGSSMNPKLKDRQCFGKALYEIPIDTLAMQQQVNLGYMLDMYLAIGDVTDFFIPFFDKLAGNGELRRQIVNQTPVAEIRESWQSDLKAYKKIRVKYLLYPDFE